MNDCFNTRSKKKNPTKLETFKELTQIYDTLGSQSHVNLELNYLTLPMERGNESHESYR